MKAHSGVAIVLAAVIGIAVAAAAGRAQTSPWREAPRYAIAEDCGQRFVELAPDSPAKALVWREFGEPVDTFAQVVAFSHGRPGDARRENARGLYQCTELVHRYLRQTYAIPTRIGLGLGHGVDLAARLGDRFGGSRFTGGVTGGLPVSLRYQENGASRCRPLVGSVVSVAMNYPNGTPTPGHVAIIRALEPEGPTLIARMFEQHGGAPLEPGEGFEEGRVRFEYRDGAWWGTYLSPGGGYFPVQGWTSVVVRDGPAPAPLPTPSPPETLVAEREPPRATPPAAEAPEPVVAEAPPPAEMTVSPGAIGAIADAPP